ncbi:FAD-linked oxidase C-terminal domain-containing protein [Kribbella sp.]|nr:FAD-linked oxidase C-terminal domain-containing protein [Kribbella sp.]HZX07669.1 FAD-linked oxidase C-terminal domain-containing protein [Kribbella sp.]
MSHHHGIGTDHQPAYLAEIGPLATKTLQAVKHTLDPDNIMNPGILLPEN